MRSAVWRKKKPVCWNRELGDGVADFFVVEKSRVGEGNGRCKSPGVEKSWVCYRHRKEGIVTEAEACSERGQKSLEL